MAFVNNINESWMWKNTIKNKVKNDNGTEAKGRRTEPRCGYLTPKYAVMTDYWTGKK